MSADTMTPDTMTADQARDLFSAAHDAELSDDERQAFDAALAADAALADEYARFVNVLASTHAFANARPLRTPNLLPKVQERIRKRTRGRYYGDRLSERSGGPFLLPMVAGAMVLILLAALWLMWSYL